MKPEIDEGDSTCKINGGKVRALCSKDRQNHHHADPYRRSMYKQRVNVLFN
jgi:hypothetical protein